MSRFNSTAVSERKVVNQAGGTAYKQSPKLAIASLLLTSFCCDKHYESQSAEATRLELLYDELPEKDKDFFAKASIYARNVYGMRSISHVASEILSRKASGKPWIRSYFDKVVRRVDDMTEIMSCIYAGQDARGVKHTEPNAVKKGFAQALKRFDEYQLAKYKAADKTVSLIDIVRTTHPSGSEKSKVALHKLVHDTLKQTETWEAKQVKAGQTAKTQEEKETNKRNAWEDFLNKGEKIEYFALLRNLSNIVETGDDLLIDKALDLLVNENLIRKSMVLPFRYVTAYQQFKNNRKLKQGISRAAEMALGNVPKFDGKTLVAIDASGSMFKGYYSSYTYDSKVENIFDNEPANSPISNALLFGAALYKRNNADLIIFNSVAKYQTPNPDDSLLSIANSLSTNASDTGATNFIALFKAMTSAKKKYDRVIILSDMQSWTQGNSWTGETVQKRWSAYKRELNNPECNLYSFDLQGYGNMQFPEEHVFTIAGFSDKVFETMGKMEGSKDELIKEIEAIQL